MPLGRDPHVVFLGVTFPEVSLAIFWRYGEPVYFTSPRQEQTDITTLVSRLLDQRRAMLSRRKRRTVKRWLKATSSTTPREVLDATTEAVVPCTTAWLT